MQRYFTRNIPQNNKIIIDGDDFFHITKVMRMKLDDCVYICCQNETYLSQIKHIKENYVVFKIIEKLEEKKELPYRVGIAQGIVRREKMEEVIEKITALGAQDYFPVEMERSNAKLVNDKIDKKMLRLTKIAKEAAEQSHRTQIMNIHTPKSFKEFIKMVVEDYDLLLVAYEKTNVTKSLKTILQQKQFRNILCLIGPEGGISEKELGLLEKAGFQAISLGPRILRTELAPVYVMSALSYEWEG